MAARKWYSLADKVWNGSNLSRAAASVLANAGRAGVDHESCLRFEEHLGDRLEELARQLQTHQYRPLPVQRVYIPKPDGRQRALGIPTVRDRVVQQALRQVLEPIWEPTFSADSYGFRPGRSALQAVDRIYAAVQAGYVWVVDADIADYFGSIPHDRLLQAVAERVSDGTVLGWLRDMLQAGIMEDGSVRPSHVGTPQGGVISPLMANIYLDPLDRAMGAIPDIHFIRYADDWCVLARTQEAAEAALVQAQAVLTELELTLHPTKTRIVNAAEVAFDFLGFTFFHTPASSRWPEGRWLYGPKAGAVERLKERVRSLTRRKRPVNVAMAIEDLAPVLRGWGAYFARSPAGSIFYRLDPWIRERLRALALKRWRRSQAVDRIWTNQRFADLGLPSLVAMRQRAASLSRP